jgi:hypothetical protein
MEMNIDSSCTVAQVCTPGAKVEENLFMLSSWIKAIPTFTALF